MLLLMPLLLAQMASILALYCLLSYYTCSTSAMFGWCCLYFDHLPLNQLNNFVDHHVFCAVFAVPIPFVVSLVVVVAQLMLRETMLAETSMLHLLIFDRFVYTRAVSMIVIRYLKIMKALLYFATFQFQYFHEQDRELLDIMHQARKFKIK